jgi:O-antigen ligase
MRVLALVPIGIFGIAFSLTRSRGGFLALLVGLLCLFRSRFGWMKTIILSAIVVPLAFLAFGGRQTQLDISDSGDTAQSRIHLWSEGLEIFRTAPVFGIGKGEFDEQVGQVAHNSFLHCFTELGLVGGMLFLGTFLCSFVMLRRLGQSGFCNPSPSLVRFRPYLMAIAAAYAAGLLSLSRSYVVTTYLILGLVTAFAGMTTARSMPLLRFDTRLLFKIGVISVTFLACAYAFVRVFAQWG